MENKKEEQAEEFLEALKGENQVLKDLHNLNQESYYRQQLLAQLEGIKVELNNLAKLINYLANSKADEETKTPKKK